MYKMLTDEQLIKEVCEAIERRRRTCVNCANWSGPHTEQCKLANQRPPANIIAYGCEHFDEEIPF